MKIQNHWSIKELYRELRDSKSAKFYHISFIVIRLLSVLILVFCPVTSEDPSSSQKMYYLKWALFLWVHLLSSVYILKVRPFEWMYDNMIESVNQVGFALLVAPLVKLQREPDWGTTEVQAYVYGLLLTPTCALVISLTQLVLIIICRKCSRKTRVDPKIKYVQSNILVGKNNPNIVQWKKDSKDKDQKSEEGKSEVLSSVVSSRNGFNSPISIVNFHPDKNLEINSLAKTNWKNKKELQKEPREEFRF